MRGSNSEINPNPKCEDSWLKMGDRQTEGRTGLMNSTELIFSEIYYKNLTFSNLVDFCYTPDFHALSEQSNADFKEPTFSNEIS
jgi:hypothetical protein